MPQADRTSPQLPHKCHLDAVPPSILPRSPGVPQEQYQEARDFLIPNNAFETDNTKISSRSKPSKPRPHRSQLRFHYVVACTVTQVLLLVIIIIIITRQNPQTLLVSWNLPNDQSQLHHDYRFLKRRELFALRAQNRHKANRWWPITLTESTRLEKLDRGKRATISHVMLRAAISCFEMITDCGCGSTVICLALFKLRAPTCDKVSWYCC